MPRRILIDASHNEETRVIVLNNGRVEEFESETTIKEQLKGNIYLAKVTRVEPSLQAAFVDYGGERHGFLPFSEIHPDYYNIPVADKQELLASLRKLQAPEDEDEDEGLGEGEFSESEAARASTLNGTKENTQNNLSVSPEDFHKEADIDDSDNQDDDEDEEDFDIRNKLADLNLYRKYKIQEVIKRNQIILIQVEKEERGNKGASLTTFVSIAGRYCVLMPNALRRGGVSRRIGSFEDRKRLKQVIRQLRIPEETGLIVRTAGAGKTADQIRRDYDYLVNLWNHIRQNTLQSTAPASIHLEGDIVKRTLRDWYDEDIDELLIEGDEAFNIARNFMKEVMPEQAARVKHYKNKVPIFSRYRVEEQIGMLYSQQVPLESGGSIVIMPTEALISIDVNSGKLTNTRNVEDTATNTNLEAAREISRQLRLRNLSGLIVIDFIDMMDLKNKKNVERELKQAFAGDRAKIQIGRISLFGLLEMSRQRLSPSFLEVNTVACSQCQGIGFVKAAGSIAVNVLHAIEHEISRGAPCDEVEVSVPVDVAIYILNHKRERLTELEYQHKVKIILYPDDTMGIEKFTIEKKISGKIIKATVERQEEISEEDAIENEDSARSKRKRTSPAPKSQASDHVIVPQKGKEVVKVQPQQVEVIKIERQGLFEGLWQKILD
jgi:ribonuclease E